MATSLNQGSAKIYQFPAGGRAGLGGRRYEEAGGVGTTRVNEALCSDSWYHEAAIQEAKSQPTPKPTNSKPVWES
ncbi:DUF2735 domain-containing protein [Bradyrhizobium sp. NP1]|uniref:DUF2735 domain-containing protein n=1 Tax=Bradyrhizobium sp. NP1 TaxID=3049772 RepID=UPI0025A57061|nr:DUF2735 domain-containing protein [Bradyrhizobium sp. NP1]WJR75240.1 DUF2735 domain-containing protein [Bradyrhizobium sp. NP1]